MPCVKWELAFHGQPTHTHLFIRHPFGCDTVKNNNELLVKSLTQAKNIDQTVVKSFIRSMGTMAGFGLVAVSLDSWRSFSKVSNLNSDLTDTERKLYEIQGYINGLQALISFYQIIELVAKASMVAIFAPWMLIATATLGVSLVIVDVIINAFRKCVRKVVERFYMVSRKRILEH